MISINKLWPIALFTGLMLAVKSADGQKAPPTALAEQAKVLKDKGKLDEALRQAKAAVRANSKDARAHYVLAWVLIKARQRQEAVSHFQDALRLGVSGSDAEESRRALQRLGARVPTVTPVASAPPSPFVKHPTEKSALPPGGPPGMPAAGKTGPATGTPPSKTAALPGPPPGMPPVSKSKTKAFVPRPPVAGKTVPGTQPPGIPPATKPEDPSGAEVPPAPPPGAKGQAPQTPSVPPTPQKEKPIGVPTIAAAAVLLVAVLGGLRVAMQRRGQGKQKQGSEAELFPETILLQPISFSALRLDTKNVELITEELRQVGFTVIGEYQVPELEAKPCFRALVNPAEGAYATINHATNVQGSPWTDLITPFVRNNFLTTTTLESASLLDKPMTLRLQKFPKASVEGLLRKHKEMVQQVITVEDLEPIPVSDASFIEHFMAAYQEERQFHARRAQTSGTDMTTPAAGVAAIGAAAEQDTSATAGQQLVSPADVETAVPDLDFAIPGLEDLSARESVPGPDAKKVIGEEHPPVTAVTAAERPAAPVPPLCAHEPEVALESTTAEVASTTDSQETPPPEFDDTGVSLSLSEDDETVVDFGAEPLSYDVPDFEAPSVEPTPPPSPTTTTPTTPVAQAPAPASTSEDLFAFHVDTPAAQQEGERDEEASPDPFNFTFSLGDEETSSANDETKGKES